MSGRARGLARVILIAAWALAGVQCTAHDGPRTDREADEATSYDVQRAALDSLFNGREHAQRLVLWATDAADGPVLEALGSTITRATAWHRIDIVRLSPSLPARVMTEAALTDLFRRNPDAWATFFRENPGAAGLVELSPVRLSADGIHATTQVGRACGEHCRNAWWVAARRANGRWRIEALRWVRVPDA